MLPPQCSVCGQFCKVTDSGVPFGNSTSTEPPDDELFCERCAKNSYDTCIANGRPLGGYWIKPLWEKRAAKQLGYVLAGPKGAAWATWFKPDAVPVGYELHSFDTFEDCIPFEERNIVET